MNLSKTAQVVIYSGLFFLLFFFSSFDLAVTVTLSVYLALNAKNYFKLLVAALILFIADIIFRNFDISFRFISDLSLDSYILLLAAVFIYSKSQKRIVEFFQVLGRSGQKFFSSDILVVLGASSIISLLLVPIVGIHFAVIIGYLLFSYISKRFSGRYAYVAGLFFLLFCPFFVIVQKDSWSENFAAISFYFLIIGTIQETVRMVQWHKGEPKDRVKISGKKNRQKETVRENAPVDTVISSKSFAFNLSEINLGTKVLRFMHSIRLPQNTKQPASPNEEKIFDNLENIYNKNFTTDEAAPKRLRPMMKFIIIAGITGLISFTVTFFGIKNKFTINSISTIITSKVSQKIPTIAAKPTITPIIPTPTTDIAVKLSTISAQLKVRVENGTEIYGLASTTSALLKKAGFKNVETGNATRSDYKKWEITLKKDDPALTSYIKKVLKLDTLTVNKASESAKFDLLIIAGSKLP